MEAQDIQFLQENIHYYITANSGFVRNLDKNKTDRYVEIYKKYINPNYVHTSWCGGCRLNLILKIYGYYHRLPQQLHETPAVNEVKKVDKVKQKRAYTKKPKPQDNADNQM